MYESGRGWSVTGGLVSRPTRWGVLAPTIDPFAIGRLPVTTAARRTEELAFDAIWVGDHLMCPAPVLDSLIALAACGAVTTRIDLGVCVLQLGLRHLVWTAKQVMTLDALAPGRLRLGVGVGGEFEEEFTASGVDVATRGRRLDEMLEILPALLRGEPVEHDRAKVPPPGLRPVMHAVPRMSVGGRSEAALARAVCHGDQWMAMWHSADTVKRMGDRLAELASDAGRPVPTIAMVVLANVGPDRAATQAEMKAMLRGQYRLPLDVVDRWSAYGTVSEVADMLARYQAVGVSEFILVPAGADVLAQYDRFASVRAFVEG